MNTINDDLITIIKDMPQASIDLNIVLIEGKQYYEYRVDFLVDQIAAYAANIRTMKVDIAYKRVGKSFSLLSGKTFASTTDLNSQILSGKKIRSDFLKDRNEEQKNSIIISRSADLFARSKKISKFRLQSSKYVDLASVVDTYESVSSNNLNQSANKLALDLVKESYLPNAAKSSADVYSNLTLRGKDPAKYVVGDSLVEDATLVRRGLGQIAVSRENLSNSFTSTITQGNKNNLLPLTLQAQKRQDITTDVTLPYVFRIPAPFTFPNGKFFIICTIRKGNGELVQKVDFAVNHARQLAESSIPKKLPAIGMKFITKTHAQVNVFNSDSNITNMRIYSRGVPAYQTIADQTSYANVATISADAKQKLSTTRLPIKSNTNKIIRILPVLSTGIVLGNFESKTHAVQDEVVAGTVIATVNKGSIEVKLYGSPASYKYVQFAKRSIDKKQKIWSMIENPVKIVDGIASIEDLNFLNERTYEYTAFLQDTYGNTRKARTNSIVRATDYTSGTKLSVTQKSTIVSDGSVTTTFDISVSLVKDSDTTAILLAAKEQGIDSYFEQETLKLAGDLTPITKVNVKRQSLDTGTIVDLGVIEPGEFSDTTKENVVYIFEGLLRGQSDIFEEIASDKTSNRVFNPRDALQRNQIVSSNLTKTPTISKINFTQKFLSKKSLLRSTLSYGITKSTDVDTSGFLQGRLGITETYQVSKIASTVTISNFGLVVASEDRRLLTFDVKKSGNQKNIDFFVISTVKSGIRSVIGACHYVDDSVRQHFFDGKTRLRVGKIAYIITPIRYDGTALDEITTQQFEVM